MRPKNKWNPPSYIDELRIGRMRSPLTMVQTKKAFSYDGQVMYDVDIDKDRFIDIFRKTKKKKICYIRRNING